MLGLITSTVTLISDPNSVKCGGRGCVVSPGYGRKSVRLPILVRAELDEKGFSAAGLRTMKKVKSETVAGFTLPWPESTGGLPICREDADGEVEISFRA
jgi:hypothetical protein